MSRRTVWARVAESLVLDPSTLAALDACVWPGNVRQLKKAMEYAARRAEAGLILPRHLPPSLEQAIPRARNWQREALSEVLRATGGNQAEAARRLGRSDKTVRRWLKGDDGQRR